MWEAFLNICKKLNNNQSNTESSHPWLLAVFTEKQPGILCPDVLLIQGWDRWERGGHRYMLSDKQ